MTPMDGDSGAERLKSGFTAETSPSLPSSAPDSFLLPRVPGGFRTILADPPWPYEQPLTGNARGGALKHYEVMKVEDIMALPVAEIAAWRVLEIDRERHPERWIERRTE